MDIELSPTPVMSERSSTNCYAFIDDHDGPATNPISHGRNNNLPPALPAHVVIEKHMYGERLTTIL
jgi:hypothetical protein